MITKKDDSLDASIITQLIKIAEIKDVGKTWVEGFLQADTANIKPLIHTEKATADLSAAVLTLLSTKQELLKLPLATLVGMVTNTVKDGSGGGSPDVVTYIPTILTAIKDATPEFIALLGKTEVEKIKPLITTTAGALNESIIDQLIKIAEIKDVGAQWVKSFLASDAETVIKPLIHNSKTAGELNADVLTLLSTKQELLKLPLATLAAMVTDKASYEAKILDAVKTSPVLIEILAKIDVVKIKPLITKKDDSLDASIITQLIKIAEIKDVGKTWVEGFLQADTANIKPLIYNEAATPELNAAVLTALEANKALLAFEPATLAAMVTSDENGTVSYKKDILEALNNADLIQLLAKQNLSTIQSLIQKINGKDKSLVPGVITQLNNLAADQRGLTFVNTLLKSDAIHAFINTKQTERSLNPDVLTRLATDKILLAFSFDQLKAMVTEKDETYTAAILTAISNANNTNPDLIPALAQFSVEQIRAFIKNHDGTLKADVIQVLGNVEMKAKKLSVIQTFSVEQIRAFIEDNDGTLKAEVMTAFCNKNMTEDQLKIIEKASVDKIKALVQDGDGDGKLNPAVMIALVSQKIKVLESLLTLDASHIEYLVRNKTGKLDATVINALIGLDENNVSDLMTSLKKYSSKIKTLVRSNATLNGEIITLLVKTDKSKTKALLSLDEKIIKAMIKNDDKSISPKVIEEILKWEVAEIEALRIVKPENLKAVSLDQASSQISLQHWKNIIKFKECLKINDSKRLNNFFENILNEDLINIIKEDSSDAIKTNSNQEKDNLFAVFSGLNKEKLTKFLANKNQLDRSKNVKTFAFLSDVTETRVKALDMLTNEELETITKEEFLKSTVANIRSAIVTITDVKSTPLNKDIQFLGSSQQIGSFESDAIVLKLENFSDYKESNSNEISKRLKAQVVKLTDCVSPELKYGQSYFVDVEGKSENLMVIDLEKVDLSTLKTQSFKQEIKDALNASEITTNVLLKQEGTYKVIVKSDDTRVVIDPVNITDDELIQLLPNNKNLSKTIEYIKAQEINLGSNNIIKLNKGPHVAKDDQWAIGKQIKAKQLLNSNLLEDKDLKDRLAAENLVIFNKNYEFQKNEEADPISFQVTLNQNEQIIIFKQTADQKITPEQVVEGCQKVGVTIDLAASSSDPAKVTQLFSSQKIEDLSKAYKFHNAGYFGLTNDGLDNLRQSVLINSTLLTDILAIEKARDEALNLKTQFETHKNQLQVQLQNANSQIDGLKQTQQKPITQEQVNAFFDTAEKTKKFMDSIKDNPNLKDLLPKATTLQDVKLYIENPKDAIEVFKYIQQNKDKSVQSAVSNSPVVPMVTAGVGAAVGVAGKSFLTSSAKNQKSVVQNTQDLNSNLNESDDEAQEVEVAQVQENSFENSSAVAQEV